MPSACGRRWFVVLPDREPAPAVAASLASYACHTLTHASGRPWLVGCWPADQEVTTRAGAVRLAALGPSDLTPETLAAHGTAVDGAAGSFHLLASDGGEVYARGTAPGTRRLFTAAVGQVTVAADRASTLAWLTGAEIDRSRLALRMLLPAFPFPYETVSMWRGVVPVPPHQALRLGSDGRVRSERWWCPPASDLPLDEAAPLLRTALRAAIASRVRPGQVWGADLSGGMDSTSVCFLAHQAGAELVAVTLQWSAPANEDARYARLAAGHLPGLTHLVCPSAQLPQPFTGASDRRPAGEEPTPVLRYRAQQERLAQVLAGHGARRRLSGHGGDHVVTPPAAYVHPLLRRSPRTGVAHAMAHRALRRRPLSATARALLSDRSLPRWLRQQAAALEAVRRDRAPDFGWGPPPALPSWATGRARELAAAALREAAESTEPLGSDRGTHAWVHQARLAGIDAAHLADAGMQARLPVEAPFCDDAVLAACLRVRPEEAGHPASYKPLLAAALRGIVPPALLQRTTKDHSSQEWYAGLAAQRPALAAWAEDSRLVAAGLAEPGALRRAFLAPALLRGGCAELEHTLGLEQWLRDLESHPHPGHLKEHACEPDT
ncbi:hypothetical protein H1R13_18875 [Streptomyces mexicanus]|uniref:Asparagine synthetase domain-containing protein n=1 Tax=Streptomyces mexicanus TaxID=178566 RepID=A0A7X1I1G2_9ACTN|nr:asparagine synthase-related protein [Streptomyces mexicanus]MBC2866956.1 hypothetical protein [Streptomyces mexicanus]